MPVEIYAMPLCATRDLCWFELDGCNVGLPMTPREVDGLKNCCMVRPSLPLKLSCFKSSDLSSC